jgi:hypothetical protein
MIYGTLSVLQIEVKTRDLTHDYEICCLNHEATLPLLQAAILSDKPAKIEQARLECVGAYEAMQDTYISMVHFTNHLNTL